MKFRRLAYTNQTLIFEHVCTHLSCDKNSSFFKVSFINIYMLINLLNNRSSCHFDINSIIRNVFMSDEYLWLTLIVYSIKNSSRIMPLYHRSTRLFFKLIKAIRFFTRKILSSKCTTHMYFSHFELTFSSRSFLMS